MNPLTKQGRQHEVRNTVPSSLPSQSGAAHPDIVVLGVMCPDPPASNGIADGPPPLPSGGANDPKSTDILFYDPISSIKSGDPIQRGNLRVISRVPSPPTQRRKLQGDKHANRANAVEAVARDLALLALKGRVQPLDPE